MRILHLSDLHARLERKHDLQIVTKALWEALDKIQSEDRRQIDLVCFTGDLTFSGSKDQFLFASDVFVQPLLHATGVPLEALVLIPGNHDVDRSVVAADAPEEARLFRELSTRERVNALMDDSSERERAMARLRPYAEFVHDALGAGRTSNEAAYYTNRSLAVGKSSVGIACLNSAWRCSGDQDLGNLLVGERQIDSALRDIANHKLRVALVHHPLHWLRDFDQVSTSRRLFQTVDLVLSGHLHLPDPYLTRSPFGRCLFSSAGAIFQGRKLNGFSIIDLDTECRNGALTLWRYFDERRVFDRDLLTAEEGCFSFDLESSSSRSNNSPRIAVLLTADMLSEEAAIGESARLGRIRTIALAVRENRAALWLLGVCLGLTGRAPSLIEGETTVDVLRLASTDERVGRLNIALDAMRVAIQRSGTDLLEAERSFVELAQNANAIWASYQGQRALAALDAMVAELLDLDRTPRSDDTLAAKVAEATALLRERQYQAAVALLADCPAEEEKCRRILVEAHFGMHDYGAVVRLLEFQSHPELSRTELEHWIWSLCELNRLADATPLITLYEGNYADRAGALYRKTLAERFLDNRRK